MKIAHLSDLHLCTSLGEGKAGIADQADTIHKIAREIRIEKVDAIVVPGDIYDGATTDHVRDFAAEIFEHLGKIAPTVVCYGNHDPQHSLGWLRVVPGITLIAGAMSTDVADGLVIHAMSWPQKRYLAKNVTRDNLSLDEAANHALQSILGGFKSRIAEDPESKHVFMGHLDVSGAKLDNDQPIESVVDMPVSAGVIEDLGADYVALGHIHKHQRYYSGSPYPTTFGNETDKGFIIADLDTHEVEFRKSKYRELVTAWAIGDVGGYSISEENRPGSFPPVRDAVIRLRYDYSTSETKETMAWLESLKEDLIKTDNAADVIIDARPITVERETRAPEIVSAKTDEDRLRVYWDVTEKPSDPNSIVEKLGQIKREIS